MKHILKWAGILIADIALGTLMCFGLPLLVVGLMVAGLEAEHNAMDDAAEAVLIRTGLTAYVEDAVWNDLSIDSTLTVFEMPSYSSRTDTFDLRERMMADMAQLPNWQTESVTSAEYVELLTAACPDAAFLLPVDVTFDARYEAENELALFDRETGLMIDLRTDVQPKAGFQIQNGLTIPHNGYLYQLETHGGFLGDGRSYRACIVPNEQRAAFAEALSAHTDWHRGTVTREEYIVLHDRAFYAVPLLYPTADVDFDWWCWIDTFALNYPEMAGDQPASEDFPAVMRSIGAHVSGNWIAAVYDEDSGLFIYFEMDT